MSSTKYIATARPGTPVRRHLPGTRRGKRLIAAGALGSFGVLQVLGRTSGSTRAERRASMPGDALVPVPNLQTTHGVTIHAAARYVWPWLVQMGWHQGGFYTSPLVDRMLFPVNEPSVDYVIEDLQDRRVGDFIPDGPPETECGYVIRSIERDRSLVLYSDSHLPLSWRRRLGARLDWTWDFLLEPRGRKTRLVFRARGIARPRWVWMLYQLIIVPADYVMAGQMMRGLAERAEALVLEIPGSQEEGPQGS
jgi:hypothetical protein